MLGCATSGIPWSFTYLLRSSRRNSHSVSSPSSEASFKLQRSARGSLALHSRINACTLAIFASASSARLSASSMCIPASLASFSASRARLSASSARFCASSMRVIVSQTHLPIPSRIFRNGCHHVAVGIPMALPPHTLGWGSRPLGERPSEPSYGPTVRSSSREQAPSQVLRHVELMCDCVESHHCVAHRVHWSPVRVQCTAGHAHSDHFRQQRRHCASTATSVLPGARSAATSSRPRA